MATRAGQTDKYGQEIEDREYNDLDFDRNLILEKRTELVAAKITAFLKETDRFAKTIVFCEDIDHAERMRAAIVNAAGQLALDNPRYVMRITGDSVEGKAELDNFIDPGSRFPVIATTFAPMFVLVLPGLPKLGWFSTLKASARSSRYLPSFHTLNCLNSDAFSLQLPGPETLFLGVPKKGAPVKQEPSKPPVPKRASGS